ncbi:MAG: NUDIX domain-containing protein [Acidobacteria bacterium]|nr:NUDIX domain-containing protein [Acidobacteriota bacterium]NIM61267.1 NUDIX domain-containing protein [Acidobacteriota bacterium]NIQ86670.1 NUDIX domain-containing protein [Acidobacteriota bacterium]NIT12027.1 NUDIX domain-containing protein [Acidobacteriota bacterium]
MREEPQDRVDIALAIPYRDGRFLVARRAEGLHLAGHWEFPGGKVEPGEEPAVAARRELTEETGLIAGELEPLVVVLHDYTEAPLRFHVFVARDPGGDVSMDSTREHKWLALEELKTLPMPAANAQMLRALRWRVGGR